MKIHLNRERGVPTYLQIVDQVKFQIGSGVLVPGTKLPAAQTLARQLKVHTNTISRAYTQLVSEGYLFSKSGGGTIVSPTLKGTDKLLARKKLRTIVEKALMEAEESGCSRLEFVQMSELIVETSEAMPRKKAAFVECHEAWLYDIAKKLSDELDLEVEPFLLGDLSSDTNLVSKLDDHEVIITMLSHVEDLARILNNDRRVYSIVLYPSVEVVRRIISLGARRIGVFFAQDVARRLENSFRSLGLDVALEKITPASDNDLADSVARYDALLLSPEERERVPNEHVSKIIEMQTTLPRESVDLLRRDLAGWLASP